MQPYKKVKHQIRRFRIREKRVMNSLIGKDYPKRIVIHEEASMKNAKRMNMIKDQLLKELHQVLYKYILTSSWDQTTNSESTNVFKNIYYYDFFLNWQTEKNSLF